MTSTVQSLDLTNLLPTLDLVDAARLLGIGRTLAYEMVRDGTWPTPIIRARRKIRIPSAPLLTLLGSESENAPHGRLIGSSASGARRDDHR